jgi:uncharacterized protein
MTLLARPSWPPYAVGAGIGVLSWLSFLTAKRPIGVTTPFETTAAGIGQRIAPRISGANAYVAKADEVPRIDWEWMVAAGTLLGGLLGARSAGTAGGPHVPVRWQHRFGPSRTKRDLAAFVGGALMMFGARTAKGCTSGHTLSGTMQLAASSWLFAPVMCATAVGVARLLFGKEGAHAR